MTDIEPKMQDWRLLLAGGFAGMDALFAVHPLDAERARKMFFAAMREGVMLDEIKQVTAEYLKNRSWNPDAIPDQIQRVERFVKSIKPARKKKSAWLVTWEYVGIEQPELSERIISIRDGRTSPEKIKDFVAQYYIAKHYSLDEKMHFSSHPKDNPYPAQFSTHPWGGLWTAKICCGHNPFIYARFIKNLKLYDDGDGDSAMTWDELVVPKKRPSED